MLAPLKGVLADPQGAGVVRLAGAERRDAPALGPTAPERLADVPRG